MGWRTKFVFLLVAYCAGFATAIYYLAPTPDGKKRVQSLPIAQISSALKAQDLAKSFNSGVAKCFGFSKEAAEEAAKLLEAKLKNINLQPEQK